MVKPGWSQPPLYIRKFQRALCRRDRQQPDFSAAYRINQVGNIAEEHIDRFCQQGRNRRRHALIEP
jgi:hypothetical protein